QPGPAEPDPLLASRRVAAGLVLDQLEQAGLEGPVVFSTGGRPPPFRGARAGGGGGRPAACARGARGGCAPGGAGVAGRRGGAAVADGLEVEAGDEGQQAVAAVADALGLDAGVQPPLLLVEAAEQQVQVAVEFVVGVLPGLLTTGTSARTDAALAHGPALPA